LPLTKTDKTNYLLIEYKGEEHQRFYYLCKQLFQTIQIKNYHIYRGREIEKLQVFIEVDNLSIAEAEEKLKEISASLEKRIVKNWKCLPSALFPYSYNIVTLPYTKANYPI